MGKADPPFPNLWGPRIRGFSGDDLIDRDAPTDKAEQVTTHLLDAAAAFVHWLATLDTWLVMLLTALSTAIEMTFLLGLLVPGESVVMLAGSLDTPAGFALAVTVGSVGGLLGQVGGYVIGHVLGARLRDTRLGRRIGTERWNRAEAYLRDNGASALVAVRFVAVIHSVVPIVAGTARMPFGRFLRWSAVGTVLWVSAFAGVGALTADVDSSGGIGLVLTAIGATCLGLIPLGMKLVRRLAGGTPTAEPVAGDFDRWTPGTPAPSQVQAAAVRTERVGVFVVEPDTVTRQVPEVVLAR
jgi:membrane-associated protein